MPTSDRLTQARHLAEEIHRRQTDKLGVPYIFHVLDVAKRVKHLGKDVEIVGLLPDAVEDAPHDCPLTLDEIEIKFGKAVRDGVDAMRFGLAKSTLLKGESEELIQNLADRLLARKWISLHHRAFPRRLKTSKIEISLKSVHLEPSL